MCDLSLCRVLVVDDAAYPCWLVLVPRVNHVREVLQLTAGQQAALWCEVAAAARIIQVGGRLACPLCPGRRLGVWAAVQGALGGKRTVSLDHAPGSMHA